MKITKLSCISVDIDGVIYTRADFENHIKYVDEGDKELAKMGKKTEYKNILKELDKLNILTVDERYELKPKDCFIS